ncbi:DUF3137 domain-containing protein [Anaerocolumna xylanovorans]|uniref:DUF3137 domain-containing protein n=1 Tax=Anaerocolumna xylanovorans DSM 12503 TaxID=1121345 RepID=A0A1M7Y3C6_9FIRM|nr:DUF3137 domain-containing protein [Anaerocolumna xylanovorans]SHO46676.1 hypothetical protein SAMN02745217_01250 [Anaerocolumna xylanovorans DSM 12503]
MGVLREVFGPSKKEVWSELSNSIGADYIEKGFFGKNKVVVHVREWTITLDTYTVSTGKSSVTYTRMRAPYVNKDGLQFKIYKAGLFSELGRLFGMQDIEIGFSEFDSDYVIKGNNEEKIQLLFSKTSIQSLIGLQPRFCLQVKDDEGWFGESFPEGVDELYFCVAGVIKDIDLLKALFDLFAEILDYMCEIGSAYDNNPNVNL